MCQRVSFSAKKSSDSWWKKDPLFQPKHQEIGVRGKGDSILTGTDANPYGIPHHGDVSLGKANPATKQKGWKICLFFQTKTRVYTG